MKTLKEYAQETLNVNFVVAGDVVTDLDLAIEQEIDVTTLVLGSLFRSKDRLIFKGIDLDPDATAEDLGFKIIEENMSGGLRTGWNSEENKVCFLINSIEFEATWTPSRADFIDSDLIIKVGNTGVYNCKNLWINFDFTC